MIPRKQLFRQGYRQTVRPVRLFSHTGIYHNTPINLKVDAPETQKKDIIAESEDGSIPWYLRDESSSPLFENNSIELPSIPSESPESLTEFLNLLVKDYGLKDIELFDMKSLEEDHEFHTSNQPADYIIICTGVSEKHIYKAANELRTYIKHNYKIIPGIEGMVSGGKSPAARRRILRRARKGPLATDNDYGKAANSWVMCDTLVDNTFIHILTKERREELNLESLWCKKEDAHKYIKEDSSLVDSDDIFIGIKRGFHTTTPFRQENSKVDSKESRLVLESVLTKLGKEDTTISDQKLQEYISIFELTHVAKDLDYYNFKYQLFTTIHLLNPRIVSFEQVENILLEKYASFKCALEENLSKEKSDDIVRYMKLVIDSPELQVKHSDNHLLISDEMCNRVSQFTDTIFQFSTDPIDLTSNPDFLPLLWRLSIAKLDTPLVGSKMIDNVIYRGEEIPHLQSPPQMVLAGNKARDIIDIIKYYNKLNDTNLSTGFKELILWTYGNAGKWEKFWKEWEISLSLLANQEHDIKYAIKNWVRLTVFLSIINDASANLYFLSNHWSNTTSIARSFMIDYEANGCTFGTEQEKIAFTRAMRKIVESNKNEYDNNVLSSITAFLDELH